MDEQARCEWCGEPDDVTDRVVQMGPVVQGYHAPCRETAVARGMETVTNEQVLVTQVLRSLVLYLNDLSEIDDDVREPATWQGYREYVNLAGLVAGDLPELFKEQEEFQRLTALAVKEDQR